MLKANTYFNHYNLCLISINLISIMYSTYRKRINMDIICSYVRKSFIKGFYATIEFKLINLFFKSVIIDIDIHNTLFYFSAI